jgi:hypothetical protein
LCGWVFIFLSFQIKRKIGVGAFFGGGTQRPRLWARAVCGRIRCRTATRRMRAQNPQSARQPACEHRRVLWPVV